MANPVTDLTDFKTYVDSLVARKEVHLVDREVDPRFELAAVVARAQTESDRPILFRRVKGSSFPVVANVYGSFSRMAELVNAGDKGLNRRWQEIFETLPSHSYDYIKQVPVPADLQTGSLNDLPGITWREKDAAPYITAGVFLAHDPETGIPNLSFSRCMLLGDDKKMHCCIDAPHDLAKYQAKAESNGEALEVAVLIGAPPPVFLAAVTALPIGQDELQLAAHIAGGQFEMRPCERVDLLVPAATQIVIEGTIRPNERVEDGPFGEFLGYYCETNKGAYVLDVLNVSWRREAYYHGLLCGAREDLTALAVSWGGRIYRGLVNELPGILDVTINPTMYGSIVRIDKRYDSHPQEVIEAVFKLSPAYNRMCIVVDRDIDIHDLGSVWWSFLTRGNLDTRTHVYSELPGMENSNYLISGYIGIDATMDSGWKLVRSTTPGEGEIDLDRYFKDIIYSNEKDMNMTTHTPSNSGHRIAIDVGGTFVDFVLLDEATGEIMLEKQPSTPERIVEEVGAGIGRLPVRLAEVGRIFHGTTVVVNTIVQEQGVQVGLLTTTGFRDVLEIGRGSRPEIYNPHYTAPRCLVPRYLRREVPGRLSAAGEEVVPLDMDAVDREAGLLAGHGCAAIAICFLHSYGNPDHERRAAGRIRERYPGIAVSASHELVGEWREFERTSTTVLNAYVQPQFTNYISNITRRLEADGYASPLAMMQSNGGVVAAGRAADRPITTLESGPAGGVIGAESLAGELGIKNLICFDVGGTTVDVALIDHGDIIERSQTYVARRPVMGPTIDISSVGAGGGSIAWIDHRGALRVGPQSAGAAPGPACFGHGSTELTVTDCHLLLGFLDAGTFLGSRMQLDEAAALRALTVLAGALGLSVEETALGVLRIAATNMTNAIRSITVEKGLDPRDYSLLSYGGGGGLFAAAVSEELGVRSVIVPRAPANFSAWGIVCSDYREDNSRTLVRPFSGEYLGEMLDGIAAMKQENLDRLRHYGFDNRDILSDTRMDVRFAGQEFTVTVHVDEPWLGEPDTILAGVRERFVALHRRLYGHGEPDAPLEVVTLRVRSVGQVARPSWPEWPAGEAAEPWGTRNTCFAAGDGKQGIPVYNRDDLVRDQQVIGPAIVEEWATTSAVPPGWTLTVDRIGNLVLSQ